jgi:3',5'-cyclic AMP phosphodiesterase CpdA
LTVRLVHLSDVHFGGENRPATEAAIEQVRAFGPQLVIVSGDLTLDGRAHEFAPARDWLARFPHPVLATPGNHDTSLWNITARAFTPFSRYRRFIGEPRAASFDTADLSVRALNTARGMQPRLNWSLGAVDRGRLESAAAEMAARPETLKVFVCHHPLEEMDGSKIHGGVRGGDAAARALAAARVDLILTGHLHAPFARPLLFGDGHTYAAGAGTLSLRTRAGAPAGFSTIEADREMITVTALGWTGSHFDAYRTWSLPRRSTDRPDTDNCEADQSRPEETSVRG